MIHKEVDNHHSGLNAKTLALTYHQLPCKHVYSNHMSSLELQTERSVRSLRQTVYEKHVFF